MLNGKVNDIYYKFSVSFHKILEVCINSKQSKNNVMWSQNAEILQPAQSVQLSVAGKDIKNQWCSYIKRLLMLKLQPTPIKTNTTYKVITMWQRPCCLQYYISF